MALGPGSNPRVEGICGLSLLLVLVRALRDEKQWMKSHSVDIKVKKVKSAYEPGGPSGRRLTPVSVA